MGNRVAQGHPVMHPGTRSPLRWRHRILLTDDGLFLKNLISTLFGLFGYGMTPTPLARRVARKRALTRRMQWSRSA